MNVRTLGFFVPLLTAASLAEAAPGHLDREFEMPPGFRIYKAAGADLTGASLDIAFDGEGRLLVGDGKAVRRLTDRDQDGVFDSSEVIAEGLGPRGPQGLLVVGDRLYAVGGDGLQLFEGYSSGGPLVHRGRLGKPFRTGGDHDLHSMLRGHDGHLYLISGDGGGTKDRDHVTEETSPALFERACSVFRVSLDGNRWECFATGGRNAPNLGMNRLGDLFSLDSDMEWHVELPWWRPVRLNHWTAGGDQGWQEVGAFPPYSIDCLPGILDVGRGSPDWGVFYEHTQLPAKYRDAYLVCDYLSKSATTGGYETAGRLFAFFLERDGAGWKASMEVLARPRPGAKDASGRPIQFAAVDVEVAPDGSLLVSDHNQGIWRMTYDPALAGASPAAPPGDVPPGLATPGLVPPGAAPAIFPPWPELPASREALVNVLLTVPQPGSEWARLREVAIRKAIGSGAGEAIQAAALDPGTLLPRRLRAISLLAADGVTLPERFLATLSRDRAPEVRALSAWLEGLEGRPGGGSVVSRLLEDEDPFVRRRALEAAARAPRSEDIDALLGRLADPVRLVRYVAMTTLARHAPAVWLDRALSSTERQARMRGLVAADLRREPPPPETLRRAVRDLLAGASPEDSKEDRLDLLRVLGRFQKKLREDGKLLEEIREALLAGYPDPDRDIRWETTRLLGEYRATQAFGKLVAELETEQEAVTRFHIAQAVARLPSGWSALEEERAIRWFLGTQKGWFAEPAGKGLQFPHFWATVLAELGAHHREALTASLPAIDLSSPMGSMVIDLLAGGADAPARLIALHRTAAKPEARARILQAMGGLGDERTGAFLREEYLRLSAPEARGAVLRALARRPPDAANLSVLEEGLLHGDVDVVRACLEALSRHRIEPRERTATILLGLYLKRIDHFRAIERLLAASSGRKRPGADTDRDTRRRPDDGNIDAGHVFWKGWYEETFGRPFDPEAVPIAEEKSDEELREFIAEGRGAGGDAQRGRMVYNAVRCASCHGGSGDPGKEERIFGPELAGVTRRLTRAEIADAIVYPSKLVADRFRGVLVEVNGRGPITGFITERTSDALTLAGEERVHRIPAADVLLVAPLETSLMPERLLSRLSWDEVRDLIAYVDELGLQAGAAGTGASWSSWRGPGGSGISPESSAPERWSAAEGVLWTVDLPGWGNSSPVIDGDRLHVTSQTDDDDLHVTSIDRAKGTIAWTRSVGKGRLKSHKLHNMATPTPVAEEGVVWALFGTGDLLCLDRGGSVLWQRNLAADHGEYKILWGMGSSPALHGDLLYIACMHSGPSYVLAIDKKSGKEVWKTPRDLPCEGEAADSYSSPVVHPTGGRTEIIVAGADHVNAYDPLTGKELWRSAGTKIAHPYGRTMASPAVGEGLVVACSASVQGLGRMIAVRPGGDGDVTATHRLWEFEKFTPDCPTPLCLAGEVYVVRDDGVGSCLDARTGRLHWQKRLGRGDFKASPVASAGRVYFLSVDGDCIVLKAGPVHEVLAENHLEGNFIATPAIAGETIYLRSKDRVYAVGSKG
ncbi:MAG TPA: PQQ-binding-like beta-propeller repeat protein [Planctomycetota bacterium]|nr:PQQ-binding-like beta-propeller repeat protein [Planctomycetota bacterium]